MLNDNVFQNDEWKIEIHISGVGMMATGFALGKAFALQRYDMAVQAGIAGSFDENIALGTVLAVASERYADLGAEDKDAYIDIFDLGFLDKNTLPFAEGKLWNKTPVLVGHTLPLVSSLSVNTVSGQQTTIDARKARYAAQIESMEGLAFHYACLQNNIPFVQVRCISNYVTPRNRADWKIGLAIANLNNYLQHIFA